MISLTCDNDSFGIMSDPQLMYYRSEGFPEQDMWFLGMMDQGSCQIGRVLGTSPPPPSLGSSSWHSGRGTIFGVFKLEFGSYESPRNFETVVLHRISTWIDLAEWFGMGSDFRKYAYVVSISKHELFIFGGKLETCDFLITSPNC